MTSWQDVVFSLGGFAFVLSLWPAARSHETRIDRVSSGVTALILLAFTVTNLSLRLPLAAASTLCTASVWGFIFWKRA